MMKTILLLAFSVHVLSAAESVAFLNGRWFDGTTFASKTAWSVDGILTFVKPAHIDSAIDLAGGFVVPPLGEAHNHNVEPTNPLKIGPLVTLYLSHGIFYVKNPDCLPGTSEKLAGQIDTPTTIDVMFSNGGFTGPGGHPAELEKRNIERGIWTKADGDGAFYYVVDSQAELDRKWPQHLATKPDFIKTYLLYSEEYQARKNDPAFFGWTGLDPSLLKEVVAKSHKAGLRVSTHIETAADFHNAMTAGVDEINHMPGFRMHDDVRPHPVSAFEVAEADAREAARRGTYVVTTLAGTRSRDAEQDALNVRNLKVLHAAGVRLALGSDSYPVDSVPEALYIASLHALDNLTLLKVWTGATAQTIFPKRMIGLLKEGYEANFIVLEGDPLQDFSNVTRIRVLVKRGGELSITRAEKK
jgi:imidazolonepropionase-like amidohydrolase